MVPPSAAGKTPPRGFAGTPTFCSLFAHSGGMLTWHDDIEAMVRMTPPVLPCRAATAINPSCSCVP